MEVLEGRREFKEILQLLILTLLVTSWNRSVNGDKTISTGGRPQLSIPSLPGIPDIGNLHPLKISNPSVCSIHDSTALLSFRAQLSDPMDALSSWNPATDCCTWRGITCSSASGQRRVIGLQLRIQGHESDTSFLSMSSQFNWVAGLPLSSLSALETLSLTSVAFNADLPLTWANLSNLTSISLVNCAFTGTIPPTYTRLQNLRHLCLSNNNLTGRLPLYMAQIFRQLQTLDLSSNSFTGGIRLLFRSNILASLDLGHNELDDDPLPDLFSLLPGLRHLDLSHNRIRGPIPPSLQRLLHLRFLDLSRNGLDGPIPPTLFAIAALRSVFLHGNRLSGDIPAVFSATSLIEALDLSSNFLSGAVPPSIRALGRLRSLDFSGNRLTGGVPAALAFNSELEFLFLEGNELGGPIPPELAWLRNLALANVSHNLLLGPIPGGPWPSLPASAFEGNIGLCGPPLTRCQVPLQNLLP